MIDLCRSAHTHTVVSFWNCHGRADLGNRPKSFSLDVVAPGNKLSVLIEAPFAIGIVLDAERPAACRQEQLYAMAMRSAAVR